MRLNFFSFEKFVAVFSSAEGRAGNTVRAAPGGTKKGVAVDRVRGIASVLVRAH